MASRDYSRDNYYGSYIDMSGDVREYLTQILEQLKIKTKDEQQDRSKKEELFKYYGYFSIYSKRFYANQRWPTAEEVCTTLNVAPDTDSWQEQIFKSLYQELYFRHALEIAENKSGPPYQYSDFCESLDTYLDLFNLLLNEQNEEPLDLDLPMLWIWQIIENFLHHHQSFFTWRACLQSRTVKEKQLLKDSDQLWSVELILNALNTLIRFSSINQQLESFYETNDAEKAKKIGSEYGRRPLYRNLGYFSLFALLKLHTQLGDYHEALLSVRNIRLTPQTLKRASVPISFIILYYYVGFCYLMMRRYSDVIRVYSEIIPMAIKSSQLLTGELHGEAATAKAIDSIINKCVDILSLITPITSHTVNEQVSKLISDNAKVSEAVQNFDIDTLKLVFSKACPVFLSISPPNYELTINQDQLGLEHQRHVFMSDFVQQMFIPCVRGYLKFYASLSLQKLAEFLASEYSDLSLTKNDQYLIPNTPERLRFFLMCYKHKTHSPCWTSNSPLEGVPQSSLDLEFYLDGDMIHMIEIKKRQQTHEEFFIQEILKMRAITLINGPEVNS